MTNHSALYYIIEETIRACNNPNERTCTMRIIKSLIILNVYFVICFAQTFTISGRVTDSSGATPLAGAIVSLENAGKKYTTGADGTFLFSGSVTSLLLNEAKNIPFSVSINHGFIILHMCKGEIVELTTYSLLGQVIERTKLFLDAGLHYVSQQKLGSNVCLFQIKTKIGNFLMKGPTIYAPLITDKGSLSGTTKTVGQAKQSLAFGDTIRVSLRGYLNSRIAISNPETSSVVIRMINQNAGTLTDIDGNVYKTVRIGNQVWTAENVRMTRYNDGTAIPNITPDSVPSTFSTPAYFFFTNTTNPDSMRKWGALYNWYVVSSENEKKIAPAGWRVPTNEDWTVLTNFLITKGYNWDGTTTGNKIGKSLAASTDWLQSKTVGAIGNDMESNNSSGFSALPCAMFHRDYGYFANWWTSETLNGLGIGRELYYGNSFISNGEGTMKNGHSVRLVRDN